jgi:predicted LPLAT superfamily acyltransferase
VGRDEARVAGGPLSPAWTSQGERSHPAIIAAFAWIARTFGRTAARALLYPICAYFVLFSGTTRAASRDYLRRVFAREPRFSEIFRHYYTFAATILDRVYFLTGAYAKFDVRTFNEEIVRAREARGEGCFLLGAHLGSFEVMRALAREGRGLPVTMVMYEENARKVNAVLNAIDPARALDVIGLGKLDSMLEVDQALQAGRFVGILGDRTIKGEGTLECAVFGEPARIPLGPLRLAAMLKRPVILMFGLYRGANRYDIHIEELIDFSDIDRAGRSVAVEAAARLYASRLEHYCRLAPYNWFNFYDFWA